MKINHNISAIIANKQLQNTEERLSNSVEKLSSGLRINRAADDPAGMAISQKMRTQIRGLGRASDNAQDGISVIETAEGALAEIHSMLQRMRELAVQASNGSLDDNDRMAVQQEVNALAKEIDRTADDTQFNTTKLLNGSLDLKGYSNSSSVSVMTFSQTVPANEYEIEVTSTAQKASTTGNAAITGITSSTEGTVVINGESVKLEAGDTADEVYAKIRDLGSKVGVNVYSSGSDMIYESKLYGSSQKVEITCQNSDLANMLGITSGVSYGQDTKITLGNGFSQTATYTSDGTKTTITDRDGFNIKLDIDTAAGSNPVTLDIMDIGAMTLQIGSNEGQTMDIKIPEITTYSLGIDNLNYLSKDGAGNAITALDQAIAEVSSVRSSIGAFQNRLEHAIASLNVSEENMTSALSRIEDVDMAEEMSEYTASNVLQQAGVSVLAQANDVPQTILQLLS